MIKFSYYKLLCIFNLLFIQVVTAYTPLNISGKYKTGTIDKGFYYNYWMPTMTTNYGSAAAVRESFAPSAMVDSNGHLYTITVFQFNVSNGLCLQIGKYVDGSLQNITNFYPWTKIPGVTPNCVSTPYYIGSNDERYFKDYVHNVFMPCLAQEIDDEGSDYLYGFTYIPPTRYMNGNSDNSTEGMLFFKINKNDPSNITTTYGGPNGQNCFLFRSLQRLTPFWNYKLQPQFGNFKAYHYNNKVYLWHLANTNGDDDICYYTYCSSFSTNGAFLKIQLASEGNNYFVLNSRFIKFGNYVYSMSMQDGYVPYLKMQSIADDTVYTKSRCDKFFYLETISEGSSKTKYPFDFYVFDAKNDKKIWCVLGFQSHHTYTDLLAEEGWAGDYFSSYNNEISLLLWSFPISNDTIRSDFITKNAASTATRYPAENVSNVIYKTDIPSKNAVSVTNTSSDNSRRLYLNTQKMCVYKNYIIYAYCYPGKSNHLYIGYAPYAITSDARLRLLTKTEFKDQNGNSFITDCSRIISLDCKNGHVWLTYMSTNNLYQYFYIKASDLVGE